jgi:hypothetical protein
MAAGGVEAALAQLRWLAQAEEVAAGSRAVELLVYLATRNMASSEECTRRLLAAGGRMTTVVQFHVRSMAACGDSHRWKWSATSLIASMLLRDRGPSTAGTLCSPATAEEAVEAGVVPVLLSCLASSGHPNEMVQCEVARALGVLARALAGPCSPGGLRRQLPEPMRGALRPAVAALAGLL